MEPLGTHRVPPPLTHADTAKDMSKTHAQEGCRALFPPDLAEGVRHPSVRPLRALSHQPRLDDVQGRCCNASDSTGRGTCVATLMTCSSVTAPANLMTAHTAQRKAAPAKSETRQLGPPLRPILTPPNAPTDKLHQVTASTRSSHRRTVCAPMAAVSRPLMLRLPPRLAP